MNLNPLFCFLLLLNLSARGEDLHRYDPFAKSPTQQILTLGDPRLGISSGGSDGSARVGQSDYWLQDRSTSHPRAQIALVQLDREIGECFTRQILDAGGNWSYSGNHNLLFAGRSREKVSQSAMSYSCFEMKTNKELWSFDAKRQVLASDFSADGKSVLVLASIAGEEEDEYNGPAAAVWLDVSTGKITKEVKIPGNTVLNRPAKINDSKHGTYLSRRSKEGEKCFSIAAVGDQPEPLDKKLGLDGGEDGSYEIKIQPGEERWITVHQSQRLLLFKREGGQLTKMKKIEAGNSRFANDDCSNVRFSPKGDRLVVGSDYRTIIIDLAAPDKVEKTLDYGTTSCDFTVDEKYLIFWDSGGGWPVRTKDWTNLRTESASQKASHCCPIETVSVSPDGRLIATTDHWRVMIWSALNGKQLAELTSPRYETDQQSLVHRPAWDLKNGRIYAGDGYDILEWKIADFGDGSTVSRLTGEIAFGALKNRSSLCTLIDVCIDKTGNHLVEIRPKSFIYRHLANPSVSRELDLGKYDFLSHPREASINDDGTFLYASTGGECFKIDLSGKSKPIRVMNQMKGMATDALAGFREITTAGEPAISLQNFGEDKPDDNGVPVNTSYITTFAASPDGKMAAFMSETPEERFVVTLIDWENRKVKANLPVATSIGCLTFSPDGKLLVLGGLNRTSYVWDLAKIDG